MIIKASLRKLLWLLVLLGSLLLMAVSALPGLAGWFGTIVMGPLFCLALYIYRPGATLLRLHASGLDIETAGRKRTVDWSHVIGFHIGMNQGDRHIGILYTNDHLAHLRLRQSRAPDSDIEWIRDLYVMPLDELCSTLNRWVARKNPLVHGSGRNTIDSRSLMA
ncbi:hypothetical protein [Pseudoduganella albidiflava]|nr:hypothetical protein [Pseudoduganella albidiflava]QBI01850.1 hypothetical protein EYF70_14060 [Pseudoduganella albidiflava]